MPILAPTRRDGGNQRMFRSRKDTGAFAAVVNRIFSQDSSHRVSSGLGDKVDSKVTTYSGSVCVPALSPIGRYSRFAGHRAIGRLGLLNSGDCGGAERLRRDRKHQTHNSSIVPSPSGDDRSAQAEHYWDLATMKQRLVALFGFGSDSACQNRSMTGPWLSAGKPRTALWPRM